MPTTLWRTRTVGTALALTVPLLLTGTGPLPAGAAPSASLPTARSTSRSVVLVTDSAAPLARVLDPRQGRVSGTFPLLSTASAYAGSTGRLGYAVQADGNWTSVFDVTGPVPTMLGNAIAGKRPIHFVAHAGQVALFHDESGSATVVDESSLTRPRPRTRTYETGREHHGVAVPMGRLVLLSMPNPADEEDELPIGVEARAANGRVVQRFPDCAGLHGEASVGDLVAFGCEDGVLVLEKHGDHFHARSLPEPGGSVADRRVGTVRASEGVPFLLGNWGSSGLVRIDPEADTLTPITLPFPVRSFFLHPHAGGTAVVLTTNGQVHTVDARSGRVLATTQVVPSFGTSGTRPALAVGSRAGYVTDPRTGRVVEIALPSLKVTARMTVGGAPSSVAVIDR